MQLFVRTEKILHEKLQIGSILAVQTAVRKCSLDIATDAGGLPQIGVKPPGTGVSRFIRALGGRQSRIDYAI